MVFPYDPADIAVELFVNSGWTDITSSVYLRDLIKVTRGRPDEKAGAAPPSSCTLTLNNRLGTFSPHNPVGAYYGSLGQNTPLRVAIRTGEDAFGRTASNGWGTADRGGVWSNFSGAAGDFAVAAGVATHTISSTTSFRLSYLGAQLYRDADIAATVTLPFSNVTGGDVEPLNLIVGGLSTSDYYMLSLKITSAEAITVRLNHVSGTEYASTATLALAYTGQALRARLQLAGQTLRAKVWAAASAEPYAWDIEGSTTELDFDVNGSRAAGWVGIRSGVSSGNTNTPVVFSYDNVEVRCNRFHGEVSGWPTEWDVSGNDIYTPIQASGIRRRLGQGAAALRSTYFRANANASPAPLGYWPVEDGSESTSIASGLPGGGVMTLSGSATTFATDSSFPGSAPIAKPSHSRWTAPRIVGAAATGQVQLKFLLSVPSTGETDSASFAQIGLTGTLGFIDVRYQSPSKLKLQFYGQDRITISTATDMASNIDGRPVLVSVELTQNGANVDYLVGVTGIGDSTAITVSSTLIGRTLGSVVTLLATPYTEPSSSALGHIVIRNSIVNIFEFGNELAAFAGEFAQTRIFRLCDENDEIPRAFIRGQIIEDTPLGTQGRKSVLQLLDESTAADLGALHESRNIAGFVHRYGRSLYNQNTALTLDYNAGQVQPPFSPVDDDQYIQNDVTATRTGGSSYQAVQETGPLAVTAPSSGAGVGRYDTSVELNLYTDDQLPDKASWILHTSTVDEPRYPQLVVNVAKLATVSEQLMLNALSVDLEDRVTITNPKNPITYNAINQIVPGYAETFGGKQHEITFNCVPESPYEIVRLDDVPRGKLDSLTSTLAGPITSTATTLYVSDPSCSWTTSPAAMPIPVTVSGEDMSVTAVTNTLLSNTGFESGVSPWTSSGATTFTQSGTQKHSGSFAGRLVPTGASARTTASSEIIPVTAGQSVLVSGWMWCTNAVTNNATIGITWLDAAQVGLSESQNFVSVSAATWTQFTNTYTVPVGAAYAQVAAAIGGTPAAAQIFYIDDLSLTGPQKFTVTRSVNGVVKAQTAGTQLSLTRPATLGL